MTSPHMHVCYHGNNKSHRLHIMRDCWLEPYTLRPSFSDIVHLLEDIMENDAVRHSA